MKMNRKLEKMFFTKTGSSSPKLPLVLVVSLVALLQQADAALTWVVQDNGFNEVRFFPSGSIDISGLNITSVDGGSGGVGPTSIGLCASLPFLFSVTGIATSTTGSLGYFPAKPDIGVPQFYTSGDRLVYYWTTISGSTITPSGGFTCLNTNMKAMFGSNLESGPRIIWTNPQNGDTVSIAAAVPEPSLVSMFALLSIGLCCFRKNRDC